MADWNEPTVDTLYTDYTDDLKNRDLDIAKGMDPAAVTVTNPVEDMIRWNSANAHWEIYNGASWVELAAEYAIDISGTAGAVDYSDITSLPTTLAGYGITDAQGLDADLTALAGLSTTGVIVRSGAGTAVTRSIVAPSAGITISNGDGVSGNPTLALANDLNAVESLASNGLVARTATSTWATRSIQQPAAGLTVSNGDGVSGNPTLALANDLSALEGLSSTGIAVRTGSDAWAQRTITGTANRITVTNGSGASANPTLDIGTDVVTLTGVQDLSNKTAPTPAFGDNSTKLATTEYADRAGWSTGDVKVTLKTVADSGWVLANDGTLGDALSGGTARANADTVDLFTLLWNNVPDTWAAVSGGRGANAAADFAAHKTIALPKVLGRALAVAGAGSGLTSRALGEILGEESHLLTAAESGSPAHTHPDTSSASFKVNTATSAGTSGTALVGSGLSVDPTIAVTPDFVMPVTISVSVNANTAADAASEHNTMQPSSFFNIMVKL